MGAGRLSTCNATFDAKRDQISRVEIQSRPYNKTVTCRNVTLDPKEPKKATVEVKK